MFGEMLLFLSMIVGITAAITLYALVLARREDREARSSAKPNLDPDAYKKTA